MGGGGWWDMTEEKTFKRNIAYKFRIGDLLLAKPVFDMDKFIFLELGDKKIMRVNIVGSIVDRYESQGDKKYIFFTLDDGSGQIKLRAFGEDSAKFNGVQQGQAVLVIGTLRNFNNETYIIPEIIKETIPRYLLVRKLELEKERTQNTPTLQREQIVAIKDKILSLIKEKEDDGGIDSEELILKLREASPDIINQEIKKLLEEGIVFEPRPGKLRWLG